MSRAPITVGELVRVRLVEQLEELDRALIAVHAGSPEGVHRARIACRRLRSALATFRPVLDREVTDPLREDLRWLGETLSEARDRYVVGQQLLQLLAQEPLELVAGPVATRLRSAYLAPTEVPAALSSPRWIDLRAALGDLVDEPPWTAAADRPADRYARKRVRAEVRRVEERHDALAATPATSHEHDIALHDLRKAAKRLRYAAETWAPAGGDDAVRVVAAAKRLTSHLGDRQDTIVSRAHLAALAREADAAGEPTFTYGRLHTLEQDRAASLDAALPDVWDTFIELARRSTC